MTNFGSSAGWGLAIAASLMVGALVASWIELPERVAAPVTAFGGGLLLAAVALELVPEADKEAGAGVTAVGMIFGTALFVGADAWLSRNESTEAMRRSRHAAAACRAMKPLVGRRRRGARRSPRGSSWTVCPSRSRSV